MLLAGCEESAASISEQLSIDREKLLRIKKSVDQTDNNINFARRIVNRMNKRNTKEKLAVGATASLVIGGIIGTAFALK
jgi:ActR/RegA family two-component response regulator